MTLDDLPTPCLVLDRGVLLRNLTAMARVAERHGVALRPHMKTAKSIDVARLALAGMDDGAITVSTLAEAEYFAAHGIADILYAVGITPRKLDQVATLNAAGGRVQVVTDDADVAAAIAAHAAPIRALIEIDTGEARGGVTPDAPELTEIAGRLGDRLAGVMTHAGHSYAGRSATEIAAVAEAERAGITRAAERLRAAGFACPIVSMGSSPTAVHARTLDGVTELRAGVYMFGDLFQAAIGTHAPEDIAVTVLASVIGRRPAERRLLIDAGALALSKDRSTAGMADDPGFGELRGRDGQAMFGRSRVVRAYQEHGVVEAAGAAQDLPVGALVRVAPVHACLTAAAHDRYYVTEGDETITEIWPRINGW